MKTKDHNSAPKPDSACRSPVQCPAYVLGEILECCTNYLEPLEEKWDLNLEINKS